MSTRLAVLYVLEFLLYVSSLSVGVNAGKPLYDRRLLEQHPSPLHTVRLDIGPLRQYWEEHHGYCGEMSVQQAAAYFGYWVSQRAARWLADGEVLISEYEDENIRPLVKDTLGFNHSDFREQSADKAGVDRYIVWYKQALAAGMPAILAARIEDGETAPPGAYDHLMPLYGFSSPSLDTVTPQDTFTWTTGLQVEVTRSISEPGFFADSPDSCSFSLEEGGCFNNNPESLNNAMAIAGLHDKNKVYLPMQLVITGWSDSTHADHEPRLGSVTGSYSLSLARAGQFAAGEAFTVYRFDMVTHKSIDSVISSGNVLANPANAAAVEALCVKAGAACRKHTVQVQSSGLQSLPHAEQQLGRLTANSVVFFVAVKEPKSSSPVA